MCYRKLNALHVISAPLLPNTMLQTGLRSVKSRRCRSRRLRLKGLIYRKAGSTRCYLTPLRIEGRPFSDPPLARLLRPDFAPLGTRKRLPIPYPLRAALHRVDQEIQHMLENARLLAKAA
jgi:hypothetical protein